MGSEWVQKPLGEVSHRVTKGTTPTTLGGRFVESGVSFVKVESISEDGRLRPEKFSFIDDETNRLLERSILHQDDVLFTIAGSIGRVAKVDACFLPANTNQAVAIIRPNSQFIEPRFLYYVLRDTQRVAEAKTRVVQSVQANFSLTELSNILVPLPSKSEQRAIAHILGTLDDKIELNRRMNQTLEEMARALFKSWFVDYDPVRAKAEGRETGLPEEIAALFPDEFEDSELGEIPKGWKVRPIGEVVQVLGGGTPSTKEPTYWEGGIHSFCTPKDMSSLEAPVLMQTERQLTYEGLKKVSSGQLPPGTVLLSSRAPIGYLAVSEIPVSVNQGIIAMVCDGELPNLYVLHWTKTSMERILANANGSTFLEISKGNFRPITALIPLSHILSRFMQVVGPVHQRIVTSLKQIHHLAEIRDALLPRLISGEIFIEDAEAIVGRCI